MSIPSAVFIRKLAAFGGYTFLLYDYLLTFPLEVSYIWNGPWTTVKILFLFHRYWTLIGQTFIMLEETGHLSHNSEQFCVAFTLYLPFFIISCGETIRLVMRACAISGLKRIFAVMWNIAYILYALTVLGVVFYFFIHTGPPPIEYLEETGICISPAPPKLWTILFITIFLDSFILFLVYYSLHRITQGTRGVYPSRLNHLLARDATLFYIATLFNSLLCITCWTVYSEDPRNVLQQWISMPFLNVTGQRLVLNLRRFRMRPDSTRDLSRQVDRQMAEMSFYSTHPLDLGTELNELESERAAA